MGMGIVLPSCVTMHHVHVWPEEGVLFPETEGTDDCEVPCRSWGLNPGPLEDQCS